jgi:DNA-binding MarR family transcriptional regulator
VSAKLAAEIRQTKPFSSLEEEAALNLVRTHELYLQRQTEFFKQFQLTPTQYNVLRILRGAGKDGITCTQAAERMLTADPDMTRLLDRLEVRSLIRRDRSLEDRRVVLGRITPSGMELLKSIDKPLLGFHKRQFEGIGRQKIEMLIEILESLRRD